MPKLFASDPGRLGYACDDYDSPVRDLATGICYANYCVAEAAGVKNWDYECEIELPVPTIPAEDAAPAAHAAPLGPSSYVVSDGGGDWGGGDESTPWRRRRPGGSYGPWWGTPAPSYSGTRRPSGHGSPSDAGRRLAGGVRRAGGSVSMAPERPGRVLRGGVRPAGGAVTVADGSTGRVIRGGVTPATPVVSTSDSTPGTVSRDGMTPVTGRTVRRGGVIHSNPASTDSSELSLLPGSGTSVLATSRGVIRSNPEGSGGSLSLLPGSGSSTLATAMHPAYRATTVAPVRPSMHYAGSPVRAATAARSTTSYHAANRTQRAATSMAPAPSKATLSPVAMRALRSGSTRVIGRSMHGLGEFSMTDALGAALIFSGVLVIGSYIASQH